MGDPSPQVFVATFDDDARAARTDRDLAGLEEQGLIVLLATAVVSRDVAGSCAGAPAATAPATSPRADIVATMLGVAAARLIAAGLVAASDDVPAARRPSASSEGFAREVGEAGPRGGRSSSASSKTGG